MRALPTYIRERPEFGRYLAFLAFWTACYFGPKLPGDWYNSHFHLFQAAISFSLVLAALFYLKQEWVGIYCSFATLQIFLNVGDFVIDMPWQDYQVILDTLNLIELTVILSGGLWHWYWYGRSPARGNHRNRPDHSRSRLQEQAGA